MSSSDVNFKIQDEGRLAELGYTQELRREWSFLHNFGASFSIIVCLHCATNALDHPQLTPPHLSECSDRYHNVRKHYITQPPTCQLIISSLFAYGLNTGGPGVMAVGWIIVSSFSMMPVQSRLYLD